MHHHHWILVCAASVACLSPETAHSAKPGGGAKTPSYTIVALDDAAGRYEGYAWGVSSSGLIVGSVHDPETGDWLGACWSLKVTSRTVQSTLHLLADGSAYGVNDAGEIVGAVSSGSGAYWPNQAASPVELTGADGDEFTSATGINTERIVCGHSSSGGDAVTALAWRVTDGGVAGPYILPTPAPAAESNYNVARAARDRNSAGIVEIVGESNGRAVIWSVAPAVDGGLTIGPVQVLEVNGSARGVSPTGLICGNDARDAVVWSGDEKSVLNRDDRRFLTGLPHGINDDGLVVGIAHEPFSGIAHAVVWHGPDGAMTDLDRFLTGKSPFAYLQFATAVNDAGAIVGYGWVSATRRNRAFLALPK